MQASMIVLVVLACGLCQVESSNFHFFTWTLKPVTFTRIFTSYFNISRFNYTRIFTERIPITDVPGRPGWGFGGGPGWGFGGGPGSRPSGRPGWGFSGGPGSRPSGRPGWGFGGGPGSRPSGRPGWGFSGGPGSRTSGRPGSGSSSTQPPTSGSTSGPSWIFNISGPIQTIITQANQTGGPVGEFVRVIITTIYSMIGYLEDECGDNCGSDTNLTGLETELQKWSDANGLNQASSVVTDGGVQLFYTTIINFIYTYMEAIMEYAEKGGTVSLETIFQNTNIEEIVETIETILQGMNQDSVMYWILNAFGIMLSELTKNVPCPCKT